MAAKRKIKERVQNYCSLFPELGAEYGRSHTPPKKNQREPPKAPGGQEEGGGTEQPREKKQKALGEPLSFSQEATRKRQRKARPIRLYLGGYTRKGWVDLRLHFRGIVS